MKIGSVAFAREARLDLEHIWLHIAIETSAQTADRIFDRLLQTAERLAATPLMGRRRPEFIGAPRSFASAPYVVYYEPLTEDGGIYVWRVLHGARSAVDTIAPPASEEG